MWTELGATDLPLCYIRLFITPLTFSLDPPQLSLFRGINPFPAHLRHYIHPIQPPKFPLSFTTRAMPTMYRTYLVALAPAFAIYANAYMLSMYDSSRCTGMGTTMNLTVGSGCQNDRDNFNSIINRWDSEEDNEVMVAMYSDHKCCHTSKLQTITWTDECYKIMEDVKGMRVVNPGDPDKGKDGETYTC